MELRKPLRNHRYSRSRHLHRRELGMLLQQFEKKVTRLQIRFVTIDGAYLEKFARGLRRLSIQAQRDSVFEVQSRPAERGASQTQSLDVGDGHSGPRGQSSEFSSSSIWVSNFKFGAA